MTLATRTSHGVEYHNSPDGDVIRVLALYNLPGTDRRLVVQGWMTPECTEDPEAMKWVLKNMDEEAEWCGAHQDDIQTAQWA